MGTADRVLRIEISIERAIGLSRHENAHVIAADSVDAVESKFLEIARWADRLDATTGTWCRETVAGNDESGGKEIDRLSE